jgi:hypothetical protein
MTAKIGTGDNLCYGQAPQLDLVDLWLKPQCLLSSSPLSTDWVIENIQTDLYLLIFFFCHAVPLAG